MEHIRVNENIRLERVKLSMAETIFKAIDSNREFLKVWLPFVDYTRQVSDTEKFLQTILSQRVRKKDDLYSIWYKEEFAGLIGFKDTDWINNKSELGYWITGKMQGKGIVTLCVNELLKYSFQKMRINRMQIKVAVGNEKSAAIPKRLGFRFEGIEREGEFHENRYLNLEVYSMLKSDWINSIQPT